MFDSVGVMDVVACALEAGSIETFCRTAWGGGNAKGMLGGCCTALSLLGLAVGNAFKLVSSSRKASKSVAVTPTEPQRIP